MIEARGFSYLTVEGAAMKRLLVCLLLAGVVGCETSPSPEPQLTQEDRPEPPPVENENPEPPLVQNESPKPPLVETDAEKAKKEYEKGIGFAERGDGVTAIACYSQAILLDSNYAATHIHRGLAYKAQGEYDKAIADYTRAIQLDENDAATYNLRAKCYMYKGDADLAIKDLSQVIRLDMGNADAYQFRAVAYEAHRELDKAIADCTTAIQLDENHALAYITRGVDFANQGNQKNAIADLTRAINILNIKRDGPGFDGLLDDLVALGKAHNNRRTVYAMLGDLEKTKADRLAFDGIRAALGLDSEEDVRRLFDPEENVKRFMEANDIDRDGFVSTEESERISEQNRRRLAPADNDGDGSISSGELFKFLIERTGRMDPRKFDSKP